MWVDVEYDADLKAFVAETEHGHKFVLRSKSWPAAVVEAELQFDDRELLRDDA
jgi:hypothetical protein